MTTNDIKTISENKKQKLVKYREKNHEMSKNKY